jgi:hypothetical protein
VRNCWGSASWQGTWTNRSRTPRPHRRPERLHRARHTRHGSCGISPSREGETRRSADLCNRAPPPAELYQQSAPLGLQAITLYALRTKTTLAREVTPDGRPW